MNAVGTWRQATWCLSSPEASSHHSRYSSWNGTDDFLHCTIGWCAVVRCHSPHIEHSRCFCQGAPHPSHRALPHNRLIHAMCRVPFNRNQETQWTPRNSGANRCLITHFFAGRRVGPEAMYTGPLYIIQEYWVGVWRWQMTRCLRQSVYFIIT